MQVKDGINIPSGTAYSINGTNILTPYAPINSPTFTGLPLLTTTPTAGVSNVLAVANLQYVSNAIAGITPTNLSNYAQLNTATSQTFTGAINAPTPTLGNSSTLIATTQFVQQNSAVIINSVMTLYASYSTLVSGANQITAQTGTTYVSFFSNPFQININTTITNTILAVLYFSVKPWNSFPGVSSGSINGQCGNNGVIYVFTYIWSTTTTSPWTLSLFAPSTAPMNGGSTPAINYTFNLASLGLFVA